MIADNLVHVLSLGRINSDLSLLESTHFKNPKLLNKVFMMCSSCHVFLIMLFWGKCFH